MKIIAIIGARPQFIKHFTFIKNVDTDYPVAVKPDGDVIADLKPGWCMFSPIHIE